MTIKNGFDIRVSPKIYKKNRMFTVLTFNILKNIKSLAEINIGKPLSMVLPCSAYKRMAASCFCIIGVFALCFSVFPSHSQLFLSFSSTFLVGLTVHCPEPDDNPSSQPPREGDKRKEGSGKLTKKRKSKGNVKHFLQIFFPGINKIEVLAKVGLCVVAYLRVSTLRQVLKGESLECQWKELRDVAIRIGASIIYWIVDAGKTGKDFSNRKLDIILQLARAGKIQKLVTSEIDRVGRETFELLFFLFQLRVYGVTIVTPSQELDVKKLVDLIVTAAKSAGAEDQNNIRGFVAQRTKVENFRKRIWNLPIPIGYQEKGRWIVRSPGWEQVISDIFTLFLEFKNFRCVCQIVNKFHGEFLKTHLKKSLTRQQVKRILENTVYIGRPRLFGDVVEERFKIVMIEDPSLAYVSEDLFEKVRPIIEVKSAKYVRREKPVNELVKTFGLEVLDFLPYVGVFCPDCERKMDSDGSAYKCSKCSTQLVVPKKTELQKLREWALCEERRLELIAKLLQKYKRRGKKWKDSDIERLLRKRKKGNDEDYEENSEGA